MPTHDPDTHGFHWGIDIACKPRTAVYATISGTAVLFARHAQAVSVRARDGPYYHEYWHVAPAVEDGQAVVAQRTVVAHVVPGDMSTHLHFAEHSGGVYLNPLRRGALRPFEDDTHPTVRSLTLSRTGVPMRLLPRSGRVDVVADAYDTTPLRVPGRFRDKPVSPAVVEWRLRGASWSVVWDVRRTNPPRYMFHQIYTPATRQNTPYGRDGRYRFYLARELEVGVLARAGWLEVRVRDTRGNASTLRCMLGVDGSR
jgi:hypothetical protein